MADTVLNVYDATRVARDTLPVALWPLVAYFLKLGATGVGGATLMGHVQRDLQQQRRWLNRDELQDGMAIAQTTPGPLAAQVAMWIGFLRHGALGAALVGPAFVLPFFVLPSPPGA